MIKQPTKIEKLEQLIEYWISLAQVSTGQPREDAVNNLNRYAKQYREMTGRHYKTK